MEVLYEGGVATAMQPGVCGNDVPPPLRRKYRAGWWATSFLLLTFARIADNRKVS